MTDRPNPVDRWTVVGAVTGVALLVVAEVVLPGFRAELGQFTVQTVKYGIYLTVFSIWMIWFVWTGVNLWQWAETDR
jgi:hypothetical protein